MQTKVDGMKFYVAKKCEVMTHTDNETIILKH